MGLITVFRVRILPRKTVGQNANIVTSLKRVLQCCSMHMFPPNFGSMLSHLRYLLSTGYHQSSLTTSPFELLFSSSLNYDLFRVFVRHVFPYLRDYSPHKLAPRSTPCIFIGYSTNYKGYRCLDPTFNRIYTT